MLVDTAVLQDDNDVLEEYAPQLLERSESLEHKLFQAIAFRSLGVLHRLKGEYKLAKEQFEKSLEIFNALDTQWQLGRTYFELGELARLQENSESASDCYSLAIKSYEMMEAVPFIQQARTALESL